MFGLETCMQVRPCLGGPAGSVSNTFYLLDRNGDAPDPRAVMRACETHGGVPLSLAGARPIHLTVHMLRRVEVDPGLIREVWTPWIVRMPLTCASLSMCDRTRC